VALAHLARLDPAASEHEWHRHRRMAAEAGATDYEVAELEMWRTSRAFSDADRAALAFTLRRVLSASS
jgi:hypothetical protein